MLRKIFWYGGVLLLAGAVVFATPSIVWAQHGGGGHGGGGGFGGGHGGGGFGGGHIGGGFGSGHVGGGFGGGHVGGFPGGVNHGGFRYYRPNYGFYNYGYPYGFYNYGSPYYGSYGYGYSPYYYDNGQYSGSSPTSDSDSYGGYTDPLWFDADGTAAAAKSAQSDTLAHVTVKVPADAHIWFNDTAMNSNGPVREFNSPPLTPGNRYFYQIKASWNEGGHDVTQTQRVEFTVGAHVSVSFPTSPQTAG